MDFYTYDVRECGYRAEPCVMFLIGKNINAVLRPKTKKAYLIGESAFI